MGWFSCTVKGRTLRSRMARKTITFWVSSQIFKCDFSGYPLEMKKKKGVWCIHNHIEYTRGKVAPQNSLNICSCDGKVSQGWWPQRYLCRPRGQGRSPLHSWADSGLGAEPGGGCRLYSERPWVRSSWHTSCDKLRKRRGGEHNGIEESASWPGSLCARKPSPLSLNPPSAVALSQGKYVFGGGYITRTAHTAPLPIIHPCSSYCLLAAL